MTSAPGQVLWSLLDDVPLSVALVQQSDRCSPFPRGSLGPGSLTLSLAQPKNPRYSHQSTRGVSCWCMDVRHFTCSTLKEAMCASLPWWFGAHLALLSPPGTAYLVSIVELRRIEGQQPARRRSSSLQLFLSIFESLLHCKVPLIYFWISIGDSKYINTNSMNCYYFIRKIRLRRYSDT